MELVLAILATIFLAGVPAAIVGYMFVWGAIKDGQDHRALQTRLGIRRKTRLGR